MLPALLGADNVDRRGKVHPHGAIMFERHGAGSAWQELMGLCRKRFLDGAIIGAPLTGALLGGSFATAQFGATVSAAGPATPASPQFVQAYHQGYTIIAGSPGIAAGSGLGQSTDVGLTAIAQVVKDLQAVSAAVRAGWQASTPVEQTGLVAGEVETEIRMKVGPAFAPIVAKLPNCLVVDPMSTPGFVATTIPGIFPNVEHYTTILDSEAAAYIKLADCIQPGYGAGQKVTPTTATGSRVGDSVLSVVPLGAFVKAPLKEKADAKEAKAMDANTNAVATASGVNVFALDAQAGADNLCRIMKVTAR